MKKKRKIELRGKTIAELKLDLEKRQKGLVEARFKLAQEQLKDVHLPAKIRHEITVIKTIISEKSTLGGNKK